VKAPLLDWEVDGMARNVFNQNGLQDQLASHAGRWVAIRNDHVVADAASLRELIDHEKVERTDTRFAVPARHATPSMRP
jgi:hypothetical protein